MTAKTFQGVVLVGFMGSGKSSVGREIARGTGADFVDVDVWIEKNEGRTVAEVFSRDGEAAFRKMERSALEEILAVKGRIVAGGGGAFLCEENRKLMKAYAPVVYLEVNAETLLMRLAKDVERPLLQGGDKDAIVRDLLERRIPEYRKADYAVSADGSPSEIAGRIIDFLDGWEGGRGA